MSYLAKLKQLERDENFNNTSPDELPKPSKVPFVSFGSTNTGNIEKNIYDISDLKSESRRQKVLNILTEKPDTQRAIITDLDSDPDNVILTIAIRDQYCFEMLISKDRYDAFSLLELMQCPPGCESLQEMNSSNLT